MNRTIVCGFVLLFVLAGVAFSENPVREQQPPPEAVETPSAENPVPQTELSDDMWLGKLVDQSCKERHIDQTCPVLPATERFGLVIDGGRILPFDEASNQKTKELVGKDGRKGNIEVSIVGGRQGGAFKVESIKIAK